MLRYLDDVLFLQFYCTLAGEGCPAHKPDFTNDGASDSICIVAPPVASTMTDVVLSNQEIGGIIAAAIVFVIVGKCLRQFPRILLRQTQMMLIPLNICLLIFELRAIDECYYFTLFSTGWQTLILRATTNMTLLCSLQWS